MFDFQKLEVYRQSRDFRIQCKALIQKADIEKYVRDQLGRKKSKCALEEMTASTDLKAPIYLL